MPAPALTSGADTRGERARFLFCCFRIVPSLPHLAPQTASSPSPCGSLRCHGPTGCAGREKQQTAGHEGPGCLLQPALGGFPAQRSRSNVERSGHTNHSHPRRAFAQPTRPPARASHTAPPSAPAPSVRCHPWPLECFSIPKISLKQGKSFASAMIVMTACKMWILNCAGTRRGRVPMLGGWHVSHTCVCVRST